MYNIKILTAILVIFFSYDSKYNLLTILTALKALLYISDLGRYIGYSGSNNYVPFYSFNLSLIIIGVSFLIYFLFLPSLHNKNRISFLLSRIGGIFGCFASICFAGVGLTPADLYFDMHVFFANWVFRAMSLSVFFYSLTFLFINK